MAIELKWNQAEGIERGHFHDRHVVGGADGGGGDHASGARSHVGQALLDAAANDVEEVTVVEFFQEPEGVAAADEDGVGPVEVFNADNLETQSPKSLADLGGVGGVVV